MDGESKSIMPRKKTYFMMFSYLGLFALMVRIAFEIWMRRESYQPTEWIIMLMVPIAMAILFAALAQIEYMKKK